MKKILFIFLLTGILSSCASSLGIHNLDARVRKLELGMTKTEALQIMGNTYTVVVTSQKSEGSLQILRFVPMGGKNYLLHFIDNKLVEYHEEYPNTPPQNITVIKE